MDVHPRITHGFRAQLLTQQLLPQDATLLSVARPGSQLPDLVALINGHRTQFEIKSCATPNSTIAPYSRTVFHGELSPLDHLVSIFTDRPNDTLRSVIANHRSTDQSYGFPCDDGVTRSGKIPALRVKKGNPALITIRNYVIDRLQAENNTYLALVCTKPTPTIHLFYTGCGHNVLKASPLPMLTSAYLSTYGTAELDSMRVALKVSFELTNGDIHTLPC